jgi:tryptophanase
MCEDIIGNAFVKLGSFVVTNYHFTTTKANIVRFGGKVLEVVSKNR